MTLLPRPQQSRDVEGQHLSSCCQPYVAPDQFANFRIGSQAESIARNAWTAASGRLPASRRRPARQAQSGEKQKIAVTDNSP